MPEHARRTLASLLPVPQKVEAREGRLAVDGTFRVATAGHEDPRLRRAVARFLDHLQLVTGVPLPRKGPGAGAGATLTIACSGPGEAVQSPGEDESYALTVATAGAELQAATVVGALRGLETLLQIVALDREGFFVPCCRIEDRPRFAWRGLLVDPVRHWLPLPDVRRVLDGMAAVKLNVLHLHLSDDQGFRVESLRFAKLHELGSDGEFYTQAEIRDLVNYARDRGIRVVPEFDMPGHATAWFVGYPELASAPGPYELERRTGISDPSFDPTREEVYSFIDAFIGEMAGLFPDSCYHFGGDEVKPKRWQENPAIQAFMRERGFGTIPDLQAHFSARVAKLVEQHGRTVIGWDEVLHGHLPKSVVVQAWQTHEPLVEAVREGYRALLSFGWYLDQNLHADHHYGIDPEAGPGAEGLSELERGRILGGEACLWGEWVNPENLDLRLWPRLAAVAERLWSPAGVTDVEDLYRRLDVLSERFGDMGLLGHHRRQRMLRRLVGGGSLTAIEVLAELVEPVKVYERHKWRRYGQFVPLNRLVDAAASESHEARVFAEIVEAALAPAPDDPGVMRIEADETLGDMLAHGLSDWMEQREVFLEQLPRSELLTELDPLSQSLCDCAAVAIEAIEILEGASEPPPGWLDDARRLLDEAAKPQAELVLAVVPAMVKLVEAAGRVTRNGS